MEEVAGDATMDGAAPCQLRTEHRSTMRSNQEENAAISVQPLWWSQLGHNFIRGNGDGDALPVVHVKMAVWEWRWRKRWWERRGSSLEVEDGVAEPAGRPD